MEKQTILTGPRKSPGKHSLNDFANGMSASRPKEHTLHDLANGITDTLAVGFVDTEFTSPSGSDTDDFWRFAYRIVRGNLVLDTRIDYGLSIEKIVTLASFKEEAPWNTQRRLSGLRKIYGPGNKGQMMALSQLADLLPQIGIPSRTIMLEYSVSYCDFHILHSNLKSIGRECVLPPKENWAAMAITWRSMLPGAATLALEHLYALLFPDSKLVLHRRAYPDTTKARLVTVKQLEALRLLIQMVSSLLLNSDGLRMACSRIACNGL